MKTKILVVDDSSSDRLIIEKMLGEFDVLTAQDGADALRLIDQQPDIELMILDLNMPVMDGFQVLQTLKEQPRHQSLRTIILTNYDEMDNEIRGLELGAVDYIRKPIHMSSLMIRVETQMQLLQVRQSMEQKLRDQDLTFDTIFYQAPIGIAISHNMEPADEAVSLRGQINPMLEEITGRSAEELIRLGWAAVTHPDDLAEELPLYNKFRSGEIGSYALDKRYIKPDGTIAWVHLVVAPLSLSDQKNNRHISLAQDISKRKAMEEYLQYNNEHDALTGLHNRRYMESLFKLDTEVAVQTGSVLIGINLSPLHALNMVYGFQYTWDLVKQIADELNQLTSSKCLLFNLHENQFVFYLKEVFSREALTDFCGMIAAKLRSLLTIERVNGGIGIVELNTTQPNDIDQLLKRVLIASEKAIESPEDFSYSFFDKDMESAIDREGEIKRELAMIASHQDQSRLYLQFQPVLDLKTGRICSFEALARMDSQTYGLVSPQEFIPIAEESKLIIPLGEQIMIEAFRFLAQLHQLGHTSMKVAVNISAIQLLRNGFIESTTRMAREMQIKLTHVILEITESILAVNYQEINAILGKLKQLGIKIAIDDFGTGYSSLARERELNINYLKIDKLFIDKLMELETDKAITGDVISMAHKLGHVVVAEGVEHEAQRQYLEAHNCDEIQGYLLSRPLDAADAIALLERSNG